MSTRVRVALLAVGISFTVAVSSASAQQPFSNIYQSPTVSPYLSLLNRNSTGLPTYQTLVRPQIEQQQQDINTRLQLSKLQKGQKSLISNEQRGLAQRGVSNEIRGTGHVTTFMDYLHYYPRPAGR